MSGGQQNDRAASAVRAAASAAGDVSGNCDAAAYCFERGDIDRATEELGWAEENMRSAVHRIKEAREQLNLLAAQASTQR